ncbi:MAG: nucleoside-diphosphate kinase [Candidatus Scalindua sp.]|jgi:nucleoside-diphosphate kinase|nr:nucleoside-diphosphate kinase [Candidatus Scalindua sp.]MBT5305917.1 nucleoside-diphosphate kinase [Candidatus Scalindua sp.]MBT6230771.1 nucleoside-diphosphate kinase [Candidatus Scalindua sp.]MBT6561812.1 nucleoside-diphosphate kinase [Candidatus Scalindua sp.]MBT7213347.1 nucleoside-diphosphate kinase [Candidatus Scalindua sp.]
MQKTLVIIKPDAVQRRLIGKIINRFEEKGLEIVGLKMTVISEGLAKEHYSVHEGREYYENLIKFMTSGPVVMLVLRGMNAIEVTRKLMGSTFGYEADPGTIRGDYAMSKRFNLIHGSDSEESAEREISLFFENGDLTQNEQSGLKWIYDMSGENPL